MACRARPPPGRPSLALAVDQRPCRSQLPTVYSDMAHQAVAPNAGASNHEPLKMPREEAARVYNLWTAPTGHKLRISISVGIQAGYALIEHKLPEADELRFP